VKQDQKLKFFLAYLASMSPLLAPVVLEDVKHVPGLWIPGAVWFMYLMLRSDD
jgi:hypothetical protein